MFAETMSAMPGAGLISWAMNYRVDRARKDVTVTLFGLGQSHAVYRGEGLGCYLDHGGAVADISVPPPDSKHAGAAARNRRALHRRAANAATRCRARSRLCRAGHSRRCATPGRSWCVKDGHVIAERYADGFGIDTPLLGFSATKSVISALTGILVRKGALTLRSAGAGRGVARRR